jgi:hypothetical protein
MSSPVLRNFMLQHGFPEEPAPVCDMRFQGLYFHPRIIGPLIVVAILLRGQFSFANATLPWARR